VGKGEEKTFA